MFTLHLLFLIQDSLDSGLLKPTGANDICQYNCPNHKAVQKNHKQKEMTQAYNGLFAETFFLV